MTQTLSYVQLPLEEETELMKQKFEAARGRNLTLVKNKFWTLQNNVFTEQDVTDLPNIKEIQFHLTNTPITDPTTKDQINKIDSIDMEDVQVNYPEPELEEEVSSISEEQESVYKEIISTTQTSIKNTTTNINNLTSCNTLALLTNVLQILTLSQKRFNSIF
jgi:hypothetical protein